MNAFQHTPKQAKPQTRHKLRLLLATAVLALAGGTLQTVHAAPGEHAGRMGLDGPGLAHPEHIARLLESVGASAEQQAQVKQILQAARSELQPQQAQRKALHEQGRALFTQATVDARAAEVLRQQMQALHEQSSKRMLQALLDISRVLSPEQRQAIATKMSQRHGMFQRHQAERAALDKSPR